MTRRRKDTTFRYIFSNPILRLVFVKPEDRIRKDIPKRRVFLTVLRQRRKQKQLQQQPLISFSLSTLPDDLHYSMLLFGNFEIQKFYSLYLRTLDVVFLCTFLVSTFAYFLRSPNLRAHTP
jgi:hypothetical protein